MKTSLIVIVVFAVFIVLIQVRVSVEAQSALTLATEKMETEGLKRAAPEYTEVLRWRTPWSRTSQEALSVLSACAFQTDCPDQLIALRALRRGVTGSRSWLTYSSDQQLLTRIQNQERGIIGAPQIEEVNPPRWNPFYQLLAQVFLWGWIVSILLFIWRYTTPAGDVLLQRGLPLLLCGFFSFSLWIWFLRIA